MVTYAFEAGALPCPRPQGQGQPLQVPPPRHRSSPVPPARCASCAPLCAFGAERSAFNPGRADLRPRSYLRPRAPPRWVPAGSRVCS